jgi:hypothetical protein
MNHHTFKQNVDSITQNVKATLTEKAAEYAHDGDRHSNFRHAGKVLNCTPEKALVGFAVKHTVAMLDFVDELDHGKARPIEQWREKIRDQIGYLILLETLIVDRNNKGDMES